MANKGRRRALQGGGQCEGRKKTLVLVPEGGMEGEESVRGTRGAAAGLALVGGVVIRGLNFKLS